MNPTVAMMQGWRAGCMTTRDGSDRIRPGGNFFIWDGFEATHPQMLAELGLEGEWRIWTFTLTTSERPSSNSIVSTEKKAPQPVKGIKTDRGAMPVSLLMGTSDDRRVTGTDG